FRPLIARFVRQHMKPSRHRAASQPPARSAELSRMLGGFVGASVFEQALADAWEVTFLSRRAKALVFAVVARSLSCPISERETLRLLAAEGVDPEDAAAILANLASPQLDPVEAIIVPFARETVWYRPAAVQRRAREVRD